MTCWHRHGGNSKSYIHLLKLPSPGWILHLQKQSKKNKQNKKQNVTHRTWNTGCKSNIKQSSNVSINLNQTGKSHDVVTYDDCLWIGVGQGLMKSVKECCRHLTHCLHVGEQPVYIHNLTEDKEHKSKSKLTLISMANVNLNRLTLIRGYLI